jgi:hypothetical protein
MGTKLGSFIGRIITKYCTNCDYIPDIPEIFLTIEFNFRLWWYLINGNFDIKDYLYRKIGLPLYIYYYIKEKKEEIK